MKRLTLALGTLLLAVSVPCSASAASGTCTITQALVRVLSLTLDFSSSTPNGLQMPVTFDESTGTLTMARDAWANQFGTGGLSFDTGFGPHGFLIMGPGTVSGTIDAAGNVTLPDFALAFATDFCPPRSPDYPLLPSLTTGIQLWTLSGQTYASQGTPLDFGTGMLTVQGFDIIPSACGAPYPLLTGLVMTCQLNPIPDKSKLPPAPELTKLTGLARIGKPLPSTPPSKPDPGDVLTFKAQLQPGVAKLDFVNKNVFLRVSNATDDVAIVRVTAGKFTTKGKGFQVVDRPPNKSGTDPDGTVIEVVKGQKENGPTVMSATAGSIRVTPGRKGALVLQVQVQGLDLGALTGTGTVTVAVGPYAVTAPITVTGSGKRRHLR
jgi:hypothetical protein